jgi:nitrogen fixation NifU-like protein
MYSKRLLDHFSNPRNVGELPAPAVTVEASNPACGDALRLSARFEGAVAVEARYRVRGCAASIAAGSALTEWLVGKSRAEIAAFRAPMLEAALDGLPPGSQHAAALCAEGLRLLLERSAETGPAH